MYPGYIFIKSSLDEEDLKSKYNDLLESIEGLGHVLEQGQIIALKKHESEMMSCFFNEQGVITHSIGRYTDDHLKIIEGPLYGFESKIQKINRHKRIAKVDFDFLGMNMILPLEVINRKGSV